MGKDTGKDKVGLFPFVPRLLSLHLAAIYLSVGEATVRDWIADGILHPVPLPGSTLGDRHGRIVATSRKRRLHKILLDRGEIDAFIDSLRESEQG